MVSYGLGSPRLKRLKAGDVGLAITDPANKSQVEDIMDEVNTFVRIDAQHRDFWQVEKMCLAGFGINDG